MKKLLDLKQWLTVPDAARHLSILFGEEVSEADVLRLALDGHLTLSVDFINYAHARCGPAIPLRDAKRKTILSPINGERIDLVEGLEIGDQVIELDKKIVRLKGVWDLKMRGAEQIDVENRYQFLTGGPSVDLHSMARTIVCHESGTHCQLQSNFLDSEYRPKNLKTPRDHPDNYYPAGGLPEDCTLVVRTSALRALEARRSVPNQIAEKPLGKRERETLLVIIAALAKMADIDVTKPSKAAVAIERQTIDMRAPVAARTIENHLNRIPDSL